MNDDKKASKDNKKISVIGLGSSGLPLALALAGKFEIIGYDHDRNKIEILSSGYDPSGLIDDAEFRNKTINFTDRSADLQYATYHIMTIPVEMDELRQPDIEKIRQACYLLGEQLKVGDIFILESTVYPGFTEEICIPALESTSNLKAKTDFFYGYVPERITTSQQEFTIYNTPKVVSACDVPTLQKITEIYESILDVDVFEASSIKVAELAKLTEDLQKNINIALMNEIAFLSHKLDIKTRDVLSAAATKSNFHLFTPGFGGGTSDVASNFMIDKSKTLGISADLVKASLEITNKVPQFIAKKIVKTLINLELNLTASHILVLGFSNLENSSNIDHSPVADLINQLKNFGLQVDIYDPLINKIEVQNQFGFNTLDTLENKSYDILILAMPHNEFRSYDHEDFQKLSKDKIILFDIKGAFTSEICDFYWRF